jgi:broad specificity phosphatase PhoE
MKTLIAMALIIACLFINQANANDADVTTIVLLRHAEKASSAEHPRDPPISKEGHQRARRIAEKLRDKDIAVIYATQYARTQQTAAPTAAQHKQPIRIIWMGNRELRDQALELKQHILQKHRGKTVLIVGHSNTIPAFAEVFSAAHIPEIGEQEYGRWVEVSIHSSGRTQLQTQRY